MSEATIAITKKEEGMNKVKWREAKICFNCGTSKNVWPDIGLCRPCEDQVIAKKRVIMDNYYAETKPLHKELTRLKLDRDNALHKLFDEFKIPDEFLK